MPLLFEKQPIVVGDVIPIELNAQALGITWDLSLATILLYLTQPDGTVDGPFTATVTDGEGGIASYTPTTTLFDLPGEGFIQWKITIGTLVKWSDKISFTIKRNSL